MDFRRTRLAEHPDQGPLGVAAHDRVVDDDQALALDDFLEGFSFRRMPSWRMVCEGWMKVRPTYAFLTRPAPKGIPLASA